MLRIGEFSKLAKMTVKALRHYDKIGLLKPAVIDQSTSYRYYTENQLQTAYLISVYKECGLSNVAILELLQNESARGAVLEYQKRILFDRRAEIERSLATVDSLLEGGGQSYTASIKHIDGCLVYCCRGYVSGVASIHDFAKTCVEQFSVAYPDIKPSEPDYCCVIYPDDGYRESNIFIEYAQSVERSGEDTAFLKFRELEPITALCVLHRGCYENLREAYLYAVRWAGENGYELCGEPRERYINGSWNKTCVSDWLTELQIPVKEK